jgi:hypothetical protein
VLCGEILLENGIGFHEVAYTLMVKALPVVKVKINVLCSSADVKREPLNCRCHKFVR